MSLSDRVDKVCPKKRYSNSRGNPLKYISIVCVPCVTGPPPNNAWTCQNGCCTRSATLYSRLFLIKICPNDICQLLSTGEVDNTSRNRL